MHFVLKLLRAVICRYEKKNCTSIPWKSRKTEECIIQLTDCSAIFEGVFSLGFLVHAPLTPPHPPRVAGWEMSSVFCVVPSTESVGAGVNFRDAELTQYLNIFCKSIKNTENIVLIRLCLTLILKNDKIWWRRGVIFMLYQI